MTSQEVVLFILLMGLGILDAWARIQKGSAMKKLPSKWASKHYPGHNEHIPGTTSYLRSRTFQSWFNMIVRCTYKSCISYKDYGGRGIQVHGKWIHSFETFLQDVGHRPKGKTLDRIDVDGDYEPGNVRWADASTQVQNRRKKAK